MRVWFRSYYESNDLTSALGVIEEALDRHPSLVTDDFINMAAELYICSHQHKQALQVNSPECYQADGVVEEKDSLLLFVIF